MLEKLAGQGCCFIYLAQIGRNKTINHRATILRGGDKIAEVETHTKSTKQLAELMVGTKISAIKQPVAPKDSAAILHINGLNRPASGPFDTALRDIQLTAHAGEILGIAGIAGNGQSELMDTLTGEWCGAETNILSVNGEDISQSEQNIPRGCLYEA